jgi:hypothetical protein
VVGGGTAKMARLCTETSEGKLMTEWFNDATEPRDRNYETPFSPANEQFLQRLRVRAVSWPLDPVHTWVLKADLPGHLFAFVDLFDDVEKREYAEFCALYDGSSVRCDRAVRGWGLWLPDSPTSFGLTTGGSPEEVADATAEWFLALLRRPVARAKWIRAGRQIAAGYRFADTNETLSSTFGHQLTMKGIRPITVKKASFTRYVRTGPSGAAGS